MSYYGSIDILCRQNHGDDNSKNSRVFNFAILLKLRKFDAREICMFYSICNAMVVVVLDDAGCRHYVKVVRLGCSNISSMDAPVANIILQELRQLYKHRISEQR